MATINLTNKLTINPDVVYTQIDDDIVLMGPADGMYYSINAVGSEIWSLLQTNPMSLNALCTQIRTTYNVDEEQCHSDTAMFIDTMVEQKMILVL